MSNTHEGNEDAKLFIFRKSVVNMLQKIHMSDWEICYLQKSALKAAIAARMNKLTKLALEGDYDAMIDMNSWDEKIKLSNIDFSDIIGENRIITLTTIASMIDEWNEELEVPHYICNYDDIQERLKKLL